MIKTNDDIWRILKYLRSMKGKIKVQYDGCIKKISYYDYLTSFTISKCKDDRYYFVEFLQHQKEYQCICFTTQSSVIDYLKNNSLA